MSACTFSPKGTGRDRTIASERQVTALAMLYIDCWSFAVFDYSFTPKQISFSNTKKQQEKRV